MSLTEEKLAVLRGDAMAMERKLKDWRDERDILLHQQDKLEEAVELIGRMREAMGMMSLKP